MGRKKPNGNQRLWRGGVERAADLPDVPCEFEKKVAELGLASDEQICSSAVMRRWARQHRHRCFIPEALLISWGLEVNEEWFNHYGNVRCPEIVTED